MNRFLTALVDDAGLFPPAWMPMDAALERHRRSHHPMLSGRFMCPADRLPELIEHLEPGERLEVNVVADGAVQLPEDPRLVFRAVELRSGVMDGIACYLEGIPPSALAGRGLFGKLRCGGLRIPPVEEVAEFVSESAVLGVPFKATQGLHAAVRGWEETNGVPHHGYLNLLLATMRALSGGDVEDALVSTDPAAMAEELRATNNELASETRMLLHSYGSCDTERPVRDAESLGLL